MDFNKTEKIVGYVRWVCLNTPFSDSDKPTIQSAHAHNVVEVWDDLHFRLVKACERHNLGRFNRQPPFCLLPLLVKPGLFGNQHSDESSGWSYPHSFGCMVGTLVKVCILVKRHLLLGLWKILEMLKWG